MKHATARSMIEFIDASPSPYHACHEVARRLDDAGFRRLSETEAWSADDAGSAYVVRDGSLVAWRQGAQASAATPFRVVGAHTDSPNLRVKANPDTGAAGVLQVGVEVYGGILNNSWLDRDLGLSGRVALRGSDGVETRLLLIDRPLLRVPQLAVHLDRSVNDKGLVLSRQQHLTPIWSLGTPEPGAFRGFLGEELGVAANDVLAWDLMCHAIEPSRLIGRHEEFVSAPRLDNLCSSYCGLDALLAGDSRDAGAEHVAVLALFDHEEVGSTSHSGAASPLLADLLERLVLVRGGGREDVHRAIAASTCVSVDMAHATHPNYPERHEPKHPIALNAGPVIKINTNLRYASSSPTEALFARCCEQAGVPVQRYFHRGDLACGSTIGPITAANLGMATVDVGNPQLSMHSARELCGSADPEHLVAALTAFYGGVR